MAQQRGPKTITQDLIFHYDTGNEKSFAGEPTTNMVLYSEYQNLADGYTEALSGWDTHEGTMLIDVANKVPGFTNRSIKMSCVNANVYKFHFGGTLTNGQTYTVSFWAKAQVAGGYQNFMLGEGMWGNGGGYLIIEPGQVTNLLTEFKRFKYTWTHTLASGYYSFATYLYGNGQVGWLSGFQLENKSQATRYIACNGAPTTRTSTQGLLDLTRNRTISLSGVSFDSNAMMLFDGTNDVIPIPTNSVFNTNIFSVESIFKLSTYDNQHRTIAARNASVYSHSNGWWMGTLRNGLGNNNNDFRVFFWGDSSYATYNTSSGGNDGRYHHMIISCDGVTVFFYVDGQLAYSTSKPSGNLYSSSENILIGQSPVGDNWSGDIPIVKFYNRALTAEQVFQNFNASIRRFVL